jgi:hypothetical protein
LRIAQRFPVNFAEAALSVHSSCASLSTGITSVSSCLLVGRGPFAGLHEARSPSIGSVIRTDARKLDAGAHIGARETARPPLLSSSETPIQPACRITHGPRRFSRFSKQTESLAIDLMTFTSQTNALITRLRQLFVITLTFRSVFTLDI